MDKKQRADPDKPMRMTIDKVDELFKSAENWSDIRQIMVNVNYYCGNQWIGWNRAERRIQLLPTEVGTERITLNKIRPRVTTLLAKHTRNKIKFGVIPGSREQQDIDTAKAADKFLNVIWQELDFSQKTRDIFLNGLIKKRCWVKTWFDAEAGDDITPEEGERGYEQWAAGDQKPIHKGIIRARVCDPLTVFWDPSATTDEDIRWLIERRAEDVDEIYETYGVHVTPDANIDYLSSYDVTQLTNDGIGTTQSKSKQNMALLYELWYRPCKKYPGGLKITKAGGVELDYDENAGDIPYTLFGYIPIPGSLQYDAIVTDMLPVQRGINIKRSMIATHAKRMGNSMWLNPSGSGVDEEELVNEIGGIVEYTPVNGAKPERVGAPDIPSFYQVDLNNDAVDLDDMSGAREVSQGRMPSGLDTLGGLEIMVEQENEKLVVAAQNYENGMKKVMRRLLKLIKKHYTEERQGQLLGEDNEIEIVSFNGSDLTGFEDISVVQGSSLPEMKAAQQERIMLMWKSNAIVKKDGTPDPAKLLQLMGLGDSTQLFEQHTLDENNAKMENRVYQDMAEDPEAIEAAKLYMEGYQRYLAGQQAGGLPPGEAQKAPAAPPEFPHVWDSDDDEIHLSIHNTFRKTSRYRMMPAEIRALVDLHYQQHLDSLEAPMRAQQKAQADAQAAQAQEAEKDRQHAAQMKQADQEAALQRDELKAKTQIASAAMKGS